MSPFDFIKKLNNGESANVTAEYIPFVVNVNYSLFADTISQANYLNCNPQIPAQMHYDYLSSTVRPRKRFRAWPKKKNNENEENIAAVSYYYKYNRTKAKETLAVLTNEQLDAIKQKAYHEA